MKVDDRVVGYCAVGDLQGYPRHTLEKIRSEGLNAIKDKGFRIVEFPGFLNKLNDADSVVRLFRKESVELVVLNFASWGEGGSILRLCNGLESLPFILWAFGNHNENLTLTGIMEATSNMVKTLRRFSIVLGPPSSQNAASELIRSISTICVVGDLREVKIGLIGCNSPGMVDATADEISLRRKIGSEVVHLDLTEVFHVCNEIPEENVAEHAKMLKARIGRVETGEEDLLASVRLYFALKEIVRKHNLQGFSIRCWPELKGNQSRCFMTPCYAIAALADEGYVAACEADLSSTVTMLIMKMLTGKAAASFDYNTFDVSKNTLTLWHCGANALSLAVDEHEVILGRPTNGGLFETDSGMSVEFSLREGRATLAKLTREYDKMLIVCGKVIKPSPEFRGGIAEVCLDAPVESFLMNMMEQGFEHHICLVHGDIRNELIKICERLSIEPVVFE